MATAPDALGALGQVAVNVRDVPRATAFYRDVLGLRLLFEVPGMAFFEAGSVRLMLAVPTEERFAHPASILYYRVADIHAAHARLAGSGVAFLAPPHRVARMPGHDLWMAFLDDSEGNTLALMSEVAPAAG